MGRRSGSSAARPSFVVIRRVRISVCGSGRSRNHEIRCKAFEVTPPPQGFSFSVLPSNSKTSCPKRDRSKAAYEPASRPPMIPIRIPGTILANLPLRRVFHSSPCLSAAIGAPTEDAKNHDAASHAESRQPSAISLQLSRKPDWVCYLIHRLGQHNSVRIAGSTTNQTAHWAKPIRHDP
jgi:hypothetical protein